MTNPLRLGGPRYPSLQERTGSPQPENPRKKKTPGAHASGHAIDIAVTGNQAHRLLEAALSMGMTGIGVNQKGPNRFIHLDDLEWDENRPRPWVWSY